MKTAEVSSVGVSIYQIRGALAKRHVQRVKICLIAMMPNAKARKISALLYEPSALPQSRSLS